jgi:hypothetical protein
VTDKNNMVVKDAEIKIQDKSGKEVANMETPGEGILQIQLPEYSFSGSVRNNASPYTIFAGKKRKEVNLDKNLEVTFIKN